MNALFWHFPLAGGLTDVFSFEDVAQLLKQRSIVLPVWLHFVVCDLWAGRWEALDGCRRGVPKASACAVSSPLPFDHQLWFCIRLTAHGCMQILMTVPLAVTLLFGPAGLVLYLAAIRPFFPERRAAGKED